MKKNTAWTLITIILVVILLLILMFGLLALFTVPFFGASSTSSFSVQSRAERNVVPDTAVVTLTVSESGGNPTELNTSLDEKTAKVTEYLASEDVEHTVNKNSYDRSYWEDGEQNPVQIQSQIRATFKDIPSDPTRVNTILTEAINLGVDTFYGFQFEVSNRTQICDELETEALNSLKEKSENQKSLLDIKRTLATEISVINSSCNNSYGGYPIAFQEDALSSESDQRPNISISGQDQTLSVEYIMNIRYRENHSSFFGIF